MLLKRKKENKMDRPEGPKPVKKGWGLIKKVFTAYLERISD